MSSVALHRLLDYILALSLTDKNKDWLASKIIESKSTKADDIYSMFGAWKEDPEIDTMERAIREGRVSGHTRNIISLD